jgi:hypothetical protein
MKTYIIIAFFILPAHQLKSLDEKFSFCKIIKFYIWMEATVPCNASAVYRDEVSKVVARELSLKPARLRN